jgi:shikimate dehydrogenase
MHNAAFRAAGLDAAYALRPTPPEEWDEVIASLRAGRLRGANITLPYKVEAARAADRLSAAARATGAVNSLFLEDGELAGDNTDVVGFRRTVIELIRDRSSGHAVVIGAGGAARAVGHVLLELDWEVTVLGRTANRLRSLAESLAAVHPRPNLQVGPLSAGVLGALREDIDLVVNATPVGSDGLASPWPAGAPWPEEAIVMDLVAWPPTTPFVAAARRAGLVAVGGIPMLVVQAAESFRAWTGLEPPVDVMRDAALSAAERDAGTGTEAWEAPTAAGSPDDPASEDWWDTE